MGGVNANIFAATIKTEYHNKIKAIENEKNKQKQNLLKAENKEIKKNKNINKKKSKAASNYTHNNIKYIVFNYKDGNILEENDINIIWPVASLTKLMTAYIFVNNMPDLKNCTTKITSEDIDLIKKTRTRLAINKPYSCEKLLEVMLIASDNYAASALSRSIPDWSKADFIKKMNSQAKSWGLSNTIFVDSSGLSPKNRSSIKDYKQLTMHIVKNNKISNITSKRQTTAENKLNKKILFKNTNKLISKYGYDAILSKTGYIKESGYNLVHFSNCSKFIGIIEFGAKSSEQRMNFVKQKLSKYGCN